MFRIKVGPFSRSLCLALHLGFGAASWSSSLSIMEIGVAYGEDTHRALISDPDGLLRGNTKAKDAVGLINWVLMVSCAVPATLFTIHAGKRFNDQEYGAAFGSAIGAVIAGLGGYLAFSFI